MKMVRVFAVSAMAVSLLVLQANCMVPEEEPGAAVEESKESAPVIEEKTVAVPQKVTKALWNKLDRAVRLNNDVAAAGAAQALLDANVTGQEIMKWLDKQVPQYPARNKAYAAVKDKVGSTGFEELEQALKDNADEDTINRIGMSLIIQYLSSHGLSAASIEAVRSKAEIQDKAEKVKISRLVLGFMETLQRRLGQHRINTQAYTKLMDELPGIMQEIRDDIDKLQAK